MAAVSSPSRSLRIVQSVVVEDHCSKRGAGVLQLLAELRGPVVARLQKDQVRPLQRGKNLGKIPEIPGEEYLFPLGLQQEGVAQPGLAGGGLSQVEVVERGERHPVLAVGHTVPQEVGLQAEDGFIVALAGQQHGPDARVYCQVRQVDLNAPVPHGRLIFGRERAELAEVPQQVGQAAHMVHVGVGDEDGFCLFLVNAQQVGGIAAVLPRVDKNSLPPVSTATEVWWQPDRLCAGAASQYSQFHREHPFPNLFLPAYHRRGKSHGKRKKRWQLSANNAIMTSYGPLGRAEGGCLYDFDRMGRPALITGGQSRAINGENPRGEKGRGGTAASNLGPSRKGSPCLGEIRPGETAVLGEIEGPGVIQHIWITVTDRTSDADCFVLRDLVFRIYWDGEEKPR